MSAAFKILNHADYDNMLEQSLALIVESRPVLPRQEGTEESSQDHCLTMQGPSPDEVALVLGGRQLGFEFVERSRRSLTIRMLGQEMTHQVLNSLDFTSSRARCTLTCSALE